jgi:UDP-N-acetylglucosamine--N-acetylmuramyl-(pentapeptide) pyrophosphoryl-undecaprenol N-acetylglucosamine transferase
VPADAELLVVFGGSLGARHVNEAVAALKDALLRRESLYVVHSTGADLYDETLELLKLSDAEKQRWQLRPYIDAMGDVLAAADLVLSRAGASSIAEISALAVPSVLVPYPHARGDHQTANANSLVEPGAALLVTDASLDEGALEEALLPLVDSPQRRAQMRAAAQGLGSAQASQRLADELEQVARG